MIVQSSPYFNDPPRPDHGHYGGWQWRPVDEQPSGKKRKKDKAREPIGFKVPKRRRT